MIFSGSGGSSSIASHAATDFTKQGKIRTVCFNDHNLISGFVQDYGREHWVDRCITAYADTDDAVVLMSPDGRSADVVNAARTARQKGLPVLTLSGGDEDNPLKQSGDASIWIDSFNPYVTEAVHAALIGCVVDMLVGKAEYSTSN
jgi:D-sedoheptulose 7-phosphate isomerase